MNIDTPAWVRDPRTTNFSDLTTSVLTEPPYEESNGTWTFPFEPDITDEKTIARIKLRVLTTVDEEALYVAAYNVRQQLATIIGTGSPTPQTLSTATLSDIVRLHSTILDKLIPLVLTKFEGLLGNQRP